MKIFKTVLALSLALCMLAGCTGRNDDKNGSSSSAPSISSSSSSSMPEPSSSSEAPESSSSSSSSSMDSSSEAAAAAGSADFSQIGALDPAAVTWGPGRQVDEENRPTAPIALQEQYGKDGAIFIGNKDEKKIYLTFDQGYENGYTAKILDTLKEKEAPAVFFLTGHYVRTEPELCQRMIDEGHVLGNHTDNHLDATEAPLSEAQEDLLSLHNMVNDQLGYACRYYRFPEGKFSEQALGLVQMNSYKPVFWSFAYADWDPDNQMAEADALEQLKSHLHCGAIYLLHSVSSTNAAVLGDFIDAARQEGYEFAKMEL